MSRRTIRRAASATTAGLFWAAVIWTTSALDTPGAPIPWASATVAFVTGAAIVAGLHRLDDRP